MMAPTSSENKIADKCYTAFFDLDMTLINSNSGKLLVLYAFKRNMIPWSDLIRAVWLSVLYKFNLKETEKIVYNMVRWMEGVPETVLEELSAGLFQKELLKSVTPDAISEINFHKDHEAATVILSSAIAPVCRIVADYLHMDNIICTDLEVKGGLHTGRPDGTLCFGTEKLNRLLNYCEKNNTTPESSWYYGDSISDLPVLSKVGHPVCINPDKKLRKVAETKGWRTEYWN